MDSTVDDTVQGLLKLTDRSQYSSLMQTPSRYLVFDPSETAVQSMRSRRERFTETDEACVFQLIVAMAVHNHESTGKPTGATLQPPRHAIEFLVSEPHVCRLSFVLTYEATRVPLALLQTLLRTAHKQLLDIRLEFPAEEDINDENNDQLLQTTMLLMDYVSSEADVCRPSTLSLRPARTPFPTPRLTWDWFITELQHINRTQHQRQLWPVVQSVLRQTHGLEEYMPEIRVSLSAGSDSHSVVLSVFGLDRMTWSFLERGLQNDWHLVTDLFLANTLDHPRSLNVILNASASASPLSLVRRRETGTASPRRERERDSAPAKQTSSVRLRAHRDY